MNEQEREALYATCKPTPALFTCGEPRCLYSTQTWEAELPSIALGTPRQWPKCPSEKRHRAKFLEPLRDERG
jgi:hypothetical protein